MKHNADAEKNKGYNSIVTIFFIIVLICVRISIHNYEKQNVVIAWINFVSMFYVLWRIYYQINQFLQQRNKKTLLFKNQHKRFIKFCICVLLALTILMALYTIAMIKCSNFYLIGGCVNDVISLCALLFSIEDEKIVNTLKEHYKYC